MNALQLLHAAAGFIVLAEALNKLERADLFDGRRGAAARLQALLWLARPWAWKRVHVVAVMKAAAWALLAVGAAGAMADPFMHLHKPNPADVAVVGGFALLIVRSRLKEGLPR